VPLFGPDPKDAVIEVLTNERDYLRAKVEELEKQLLALTSTHAYRLVHGEDVGPPARPPTPDVYTLKATDAKPDFTLAQVEAHFRRLSD
jgi:hypothetical protein